MIMLPSMMVMTGLSLVIIVTKHTKSNLRCSFYHFKCCSHENIVFWTACERYRNLEESQGAEKLSLARCLLFLSYFLLYITSTNQVIIIGS